MKGFSQFCEEQTGSYVAVKYGPVGINSILANCRVLGIPNLISPDKMHTTLIYSRVPLTNYLVPRNVSHIVVGSLTPDVFVTQSGKRAFVLKISDPWFNDRHSKIMLDNPKATYDYPDYTAHITISYDIGDTEVPDSFEIEQGDLVVTREYYEDLKLNWSA